MDAPHWRLIVNGKCAESEPLRDAVAHWRDRGADIGVRVTWEGGDAARYVDEALADGVGCIVAAGGDGTLNEVVNAMAADARDGEALPSLGVVPGGTANDFATACGIPDDPLAALGLVADAPAAPVDLGRIGERWFINVATGGFGTEVTNETSDELKRMLGRAAYVLTGLRRFASVRSAFGRFRAEDFAWEGDFLVLAIGNGRQAGGGQQLCPDALLDDGLLDVALLPDPPEGRFMEALANTLAQGRAAIDEATVRVRVPWIEIESAPDAPLHLNLDGEPMSAGHVRVETVPRRLRVHLPPECLLRR